MVMRRRCQISQQRAGASIVTHCWRPFAFPYLTPVADSKINPLRKARNGLPLFAACQSPSHASWASQ